MSRRSKKTQKESKAGQQVPATTQDTEVVVLQDTSSTLTEEMSPMEEITSATTPGAEVNAMPTTNQEVSPMEHKTEVITEAADSDQQNQVNPDINEDLDPFGSAMADDYRYDQYLDDTDDFAGDPLFPLRLKVNADFGTNVLKFAHERLQMDAHKLKGQYDSFERLHCCNGDGCVACKASTKGAQTVEIELFFDLDERHFVGYASPSSRRRDSFGAKLRKACAGQIPCVLKVSRSDSGGYQLKRNDNHGFATAELAPRVSAFRQALGRGEVDFDDILPQIDNDEMMEIPAIRNNLPIDYQV